VRKVLPVARFQVTVARDGEECLHFLRTHPNGYDILLLDLMMPEVSGYDVLREMTLSGIHSELPVMVLTNFPDPGSEEERRLLEDGMVLDVVSKSAVHNDPHYLAQVLDRHLRAARAGQGEWEDGRRAA
jgi:CheY-like chemotaxis protein